MVKSKYALSGWEMYLACWDRELLLVKRNIFLYGFRTFQTVLLAVATALVFVKPRMHTNTQDDGNRFISVLFFSLMICLFDGVTELNLTVRSFCICFQVTTLQFDEQSQASDRASMVLILQMS